MHSSVNRSQVSSKSGPAAPRRKPLGGYLIEAGLLTPAQVDVALNDQKLTGMRFGEILAARGWVKQQTIEYLMQKVVLPEQRAMERKVENGDARPGRDARTASPPPAPKPADPMPSGPLNRRDIPVSKPLPSVGSSDGDVSWVG